MARVGDRRVGKRLADDGDGHAVHFADDVRLEHRIAEIQGSDILREKLDAACEVLADHFPDPLRAIGELPVTGHDVDAEQLRGIDHVLAARPQ
ncbi:hypothetical protein D3C83_23130 [compost metagenome]